MTVTAEAGSTVITFSAQTLETLEEGEHVITVRFDDGEAEARLAVVSGRENPQTGVCGSYGLCSMMLIVFVPAAAVLMRRKKSQENS